MKYQVLLEHPRLQMKRYFCSTLMLSVWWENRTDEPGAQYHFVITGRLFLRCNAPISLSFCFLYVQRSEAPSENHAGDFNVSSQVLQISTFFFHSCIVWFWFMCITIMLHMIPIRKYPYKDSLYISRHTFMSFNEDSNAEYPLSIVI